MARRVSLRIGGGVRREVGWWWSRRRRRRLHEFTKRRGNLARGAGRSWLPRTFAGICGKHAKVEGLALDEGVCPFTDSRTDSEHL